MEKVIVIGVDGATLDLMETWMDKGLLPAFNHLRKQGSYGRLQSTTPYYSAPAWVSIVTGTSPGKHGIYDFFRTDTFTKKLVNSRSRKTPAIWNYLTENEKSSIVVNVPGTYPPEKIKGVMITGLLTPSPESEYTFPSDIKQHLTKENLGIYELEQVAVDDLPKNLYAQYAPEKLVANINRYTISHGTVFINLLKKHPWDFAMVVFRGTDDAQHLLWGKPDHVLSCYQKADEYIGKIMDAFPEASIVIVSDHGFEKPEKYLYVNNLLYNHGFLISRTDPQYSIDNLLLSVFDAISRMLFHALPFEKLVRSEIGRKFILSSGSTTNIDFTKTKAFYHSVCSRGIRVVLEEKYPNGVVKKQEYETIRNQLIDLFTQLIDPENGKKVIKRVYKGEEIYTNTAVNDPLDLILEFNRGYGAQELLRSPQGIRGFFNSHEKTLPVLTKPGFYDWMGDHHPEGIVFLYGTQIKKGAQIHASVMDIVPTVLTLLQQPIPNIIDGEVITNAFVKQPMIKKIDLDGKKSKLSLGELEKIRHLRKKF